MFIIFVWYGSGMMMISDIWLEKFLIKIVIYCCLEVSIVLLDMCSLSVCINELIGIKSISVGIIDVEDLLF